MRVIHFLMMVLLPYTGFSASPTGEKLGSYKIDSAGITVSGLSSGAFMAVQLQVIHSKIFSGLASIAGGIFGCAEGHAKLAQTKCMNHPEGIQSSTFVEKAKDLAKAGLIDPLDNLSTQKVFIYTGTKDKVVAPAAADKLTEFYQTWVDPKNITTERLIPSGHGFPTVANGNACDVSVIPWISKCNYDGAGEILKSLYGSLRPRGAFIPTNLHLFSQKEFADSKSSIYSTGWIYVPSACAAGETCRLHVALHGCQMNPDWIQDRFEKQAGYNEWAESNQIIILYPQSAAKTNDNPYACWDWFGFTGPEYLTNKGPQIIALMKMIERIRQP